METIIVLMSVAFVAWMIYVMVSGVVGVSKEAHDNTRKIHNNMDLRATLETDMAMARQSLLMAYEGPPLSPSELDNLAYAIVCRGNESLKRRGYLT